MIILTQAYNQVFNNHPYNTELIKQLNDYIAPIGGQNTGISYAQLCSGLSLSLKAFGRTVLLNMIHDMDKQFRNSSGRLSRYYVKNTRERTITTIFGPITFKRTEYQDRSTGDNYCYVDRKLGIMKRDRYDCNIAALAAEMYANNNSMIKVGELIGQMISGYELDPDNERTAISRQQIFKMINRIKRMKIAPAMAEETPETLYIMADEKYISLQYKTKDETEDQPRKKMNKLAVAFSGREQLVKKDGSVQKRWVLTDKWIFSYDSGYFWPQLHDDMAQRYDEAKIKKIYILGDGASWIKTGAADLKTADTRAKFALDRFHFGQALTKITKDKEKYKLLFDYALHQDKESFQELIDSIIEDKPQNKETIQKNSDYIIKQLKGIKTMYQEVKIGCAMEQAISHIIASSFSSVPKAYGEEHLATYINNRINQQNGINIRRHYIEALDMGLDEDGTADFTANRLDMSMFDGPSDTYRPAKTSIKHRNKSN
jgi:hypothetical protein